MKEERRRKTEKKLPCEKKQRRRVLACIREIREIHPQNPRIILQVIYAIFSSSKITKWKWKMARNGSDMMSMLCSVSWVFYYCFVLCCVLCFVLCCETMWMIHANKRLWGRCCPIATVAKVVHHTPSSDKPYEYVWPTKLLHSPRDLKITFGLFSDVHNAKVQFV